MKNNINVGTTPYQEINEVLLTISNGINHILDNNLIGLYLFGSLTYGDFNLDSSDIDLVTIVNKPLSPHEPVFGRKYY